MGIGEVVVDAILILPATSASLLFTFLRLFLSKCHAGAAFLTLATSLLPALVVSYGPQLAGPLPATFTFSNRLDVDNKVISIEEILCSSGAVLDCLASGEPRPDTVWVTAEGVGLL